ncbi:MAG: winged helix-turn-helix transcriptional regulator [Firmicutes bacterium]|nr:winged helix-turn-helix transcriptional regulator [Bacillota bacterium]
MKNLAACFKALGDETRLRIIRMLSEREMCVCELIDVLPMSQPAVSHHLKILKQVGFVNDRRDGKWIYYSLNLEHFENCQQAFTNSFIKPIREILDRGAPLPADSNICKQLEKRSGGNC